MRPNSSPPPPVLLLRTAALLAAAGWAPGSASIASADIFKMRSGDAFEGEILLSKPEKVYVRIFGGAKWFARADIAEIVPAPSPWQRYEEVRRKFPLTAAAQFELAMWCGANRLDDEKEKHLRTALALDPAYEPAGVALGFVQVDGKWVAPKKPSLDLPGARGPVGPVAKDAGRPGTDPARPDPARPDPKTAAAKKAEEDAERRLRNRWAYDIAQLYATSLRSTDAEIKAEGLRRLAAVNDPLACDGVIENLCQRSDSAVRRGAMRALGRFRTERALLQLVASSLTDSDPLVCIEARNELRAAADPRVGAVLRAGLDGPEDLLDRCAETLGAMKDFDSVPALLAVLSGPNRPAADEDPDAVAAFLRGAQRTLGSRGQAVFEPHARLISDPVWGQLTGRHGSVGKRLKNPGAPPTTKFRTRVLDALVKISGGEKNFGFQRAEWEAWYNNKRAGAAAR